jgi:hypothetical protein
MPSGNKVIFAQRDIIAPTNDELEVAVAAEVANLVAKNIDFDLGRLPSTVGGQSATRIQLIAYKDKLPETIPNNYRRFQVGSNYKIQTQEQ